MMIKNNVARLALFFPMAVLLAGATACVSTHALPRIDGKEVVAMVNGEPITREEYEKGIASMHAAKQAETQHAEETAGGDRSAPKKPGPIDYEGLLKRQVDARLIVQEAKRIGLDDLPEYKETMEKYSEGVLRMMLMKQALKDVKPDAAVVDERYQKAIREWKLTSVMFPKEEDAKHMEAEISAGGQFDDLMNKAITDKKARGGRYEEYQTGEEMTPSVYDALLSMGTGSTTPVLPVPGGYAIVKVDDFRLQEDQERRDAAYEFALQLKKKEASTAYVESVKTKLVKTDTALLDSIDFETTVDAFEQMTKDDRVIAEIAGNGRITVMDLAGAMQQKYFHGLERMLGKKGLNTKKYDTMEQMVERKALVQEARNTGIDKTEEYSVLIKTYEDAQLFGLFLQKVVLPEVKVTDAESKAYYDGHLSDYASPERMQLDGIVFNQRSDAEDAMQRLRAGDQFSWIKEHAEGQGDRSAVESLGLGGMIVAMPALSDGLRNALSGANAGDTRLYESPQGQFYVISVIAVFPPSVQDYTAVRQPIVRQLYNEHLQAGVADWVAKLRAAAEVKVYMKY